MPVKTPQSGEASSSRPDGIGAADHADDAPINEKDQQLAAVRNNGNGQALTTNQGLKVSTTDDSLRAGDRGPTLLEDFHFREKMTHFDHERMPERVVHARGVGAHGMFQPYAEASALSKAGFLQNPDVQTPVFVRFSTVAGSRGSADTVRDVRGFAVKFYTQEGNFDLVGNNIPIFFIQDAVKFPDLVHAVKPEAPDEIPQAQTAHDTAWDFFSLVPETTHMVMWIMSDRAIPRSLRMMEGFGIHTFRLIDASGTSRFVKFHWKPLQGVYSLVWDEAQKLAGKDPDFHRRDLWDAIEAGAFPSWELGVQVIEETDEDQFNFDILDATKIWPEELVPVQRIGKMTLTRNPDNYFAETEQVAFHLGNIVPGIDFTDDPLLQGRLFSYLDTQINRFNGVNFHQVPINRAVCPVHNFQFDGYQRQSIPVGRASYFPNSVGDNTPAPVPEQQGGFVSYEENVNGKKVRKRSDTFNDHYTQARLFYKSLSAPEQQHMTDAFRFELGKVGRQNIREAMVSNLAQVDTDLATTIATWIGVEAPAGGKETAQTARFKDETVDTSPTLSIENLKTDSIATRKIAILVADGVSAADVNAVTAALTAEGAIYEVVAKTLGTVKADDGSLLPVDRSAITVDSVLYDAVYVPGGAQSVETLSGMVKARSFVAEAYAHAKPIGASGHGVGLLKEANLPTAQNTNNGSDGVASDLGVVSCTGSANGTEFVTQFIAAIGQHRFWDRPNQV